MRKTTMAAVISSILLGAVAAQAADTSSTSSTSTATDTKISSDQFKAADKNRDGNLSMSEVQASMPTVASRFSSIDTNGDGKISASELSSYNKAMEADQSTTGTKSQ